MASPVNDTVVRAACGTLVRTVCWSCICFGMFCVSSASEPGAAAVAGVPVELCSVVADARCQGGGVSVPCSASPLPPVAGCSGAEPDSVPAVPALSSTVWVLTEARSASCCGSDCSGFSEGVTSDPSMIVGGGVRRGLPRFYFCCSGPAASGSAASSALRAIATSVDPSSRFIRRTPFVCLPALRTSLAVVRMTPPVEVIA